MGLEVVEKLVQIHVLRLTGHVPSECHHLNIFRVVAFLSQDACIVLLKGINDQLFGVNLVIGLFDPLLNHLRRPSNISNDLLFLMHLSLLPISGFILVLPQSIDLVISSNDR